MDDDDDDDDDLVRLEGYFSLKLYQLPFFVCHSNEGFGETAPPHKLV